MPLPLLCKLAFAATAAGKQPALDPHALDYAAVPLQSSAPAWESLLRGWAASSALPGDRPARSEPPAVRWNISGGGTAAAPRAAAWQGTPLPGGQLGQRNAAAGFPPLPLDWLAARHEPSRSAPSAAANPYPEAQHAPAPAAGAGPGTWGSAVAAEPAGGQGWRLHSGPRREGLVPAAGAGHGMQQAAAAAAAAAAGARWHQGHQQAGHEAAAAAGEQGARTHHRLQQARRTPGAHRHWVQRGRAAACVAAAVRQCACAVPALCMPPAYESASPGPCPGVSPPRHPRRVRLPPAPAASSRCPAVQTRGRARHAVRALFHAGPGWRGGLRRHPCAPPNRAH